MKVAILTLVVLAMPVSASGTEAEDEFSRCERIRVEIASLEADAKQLSATIEALLPTYEAMSFDEKTRFLNDRLNLSQIEFVIIVGNGVLRRCSILYPKT